MSSSKRLLKPPPPHTPQPRIFCSMQLKKNAKMLPSARYQDGGCAGRRGDVYDVKRRRRRRKSNSWSTVMEKEREDLERQIRLLQGLISCHHKLHGNAPATSRWRNPPAQPDHGSDERYHGGRPPLPSNPTHTWRKKYSLVNRCEQAGPAPGVPSNASSRGDAPPPLSDGKIRNLKVGTKDPNTSVCPLQVPTAQGGHGNLQNVKHRTHPESPSTTAVWQAHPKPLAPAAPPSKVASKESLDGRPPSFPPDQAGAPRSASAKLVYPHVMTDSPVALTSPDARVDPAKRRLVTAHKVFCSPKSAFALQGSAPHASKTPRARKNKYTWVANSARPGLCGKKSSPLAKKIVSADAVRIRSPTAAVATKAKKCGIQGKPGNPRNRYRWKANQPSLAPSGPALASPHLSVPQSVDQGSTPRLHGPSREAGKGSASPAAPKASLNDQTPSSYKVKSRTKLIRRRSSSSPTEKKAPPLEPLTMKSRYSLRRRSSPRVKTQIVVKKTSPKGLVHITKHRLRRLPPPKQQQPDVSRAGPVSPALKSPTPSRVIKSRYRIVKRNASPALPSTFSTSLNARTRLLTRIHPSPPGGRILPGQQRWRGGRGLCIIGGHMYRVSANKLSRTWSPGTTSKQTPKAGKKDLRSPSPGASYPGRPATPSQYIASRAVQRSLAIIRQAQQRKDKEYCMYYNRFGKCNRAQRCPYLHDPEKVAVCTRFLRGTCKETDGTCPFSHHVSKEKMPVCSYFLKGACHNSNCPYSHVYVSRKAALCQDFIKGYCPLGEKCKRKHTLLCPDYAREGRCARGAKCQLQHRQRKRRHEDPTQPSSEHKLPAESRTRDGDLLDKSGICSSDEEFPGATSDKLPSFISLNCSLSPPSDVTPQTKKVKPAEDSGKPLHIKPRL